MGNNEPNYFGLNLGQAIAAGAGSISEGLQRRYAIQRREEEMARQREEEKAAQNQSMRLNFAKSGIEYDPNNPESAFTEFAKVGKSNMATDTQYKQAQINALNARAIPGSDMKAPTGYRPTKEGNLEMIPGGPADLKAQAEMTKTKESQATQDERIANTKMRVDKAIDRLGFFTTGFGADALSKIGGTDARSLKGDLDTIKANLGFDRLTQMRNESKTGGALGNVSDRELTLLTAAAASLDQGMKKSDLQANLLQIKQILDKAKSTPTGQPAPDTGRIRVMNKATGKTGSMPKANFDPSKYDQI